MPDSGATLLGDRTATSEWLGSRLPYSKRSTFVESHSRIPSVLLSRPPVQCEIFNDLDNRVSDWWRTLRDEPVSNDNGPDMDYNHSLLVKRLWNVQLEHRNPVDLIERLSAIPSAFLYIDATESITDAHAITTAIEGFAGKIAVLGARNPWPALKWNAEHVPIESDGLQLTLWTNYDPCALEYGQSKLLL